MLFKDLKQGDQFVLLGDIKSGGNKVYVKLINQFFALRATHTWRNLMNTSKITTKELLAEMEGNIFNSVFLKSGLTTNIPDDTEVIKLI